MPCHDPIDLTYNAFSRSSLRPLSRRRILHSSLSKSFDRINVLGEGEDDGHTGCVNALSWASENVLLSGGDDTTIRVWRMDQYADSTQDYPFHTSTVIKTGHRDNIFGVRCLPYSSTIVTVARDCQVRVFDLTTTNTLPYETPGTPHTHSATYSSPQLVSHILTCHRDSVKRIVTEDSPDRFLTVSEDGSVRQHDLRTPHTCRSGCPAPLMKASFDLSTLSSSSRAPHHFVVGGSSEYGFLFDRRHIRDIRSEWGEIPGLSGDNFTNCVLRFGRPIRSGSRFDHITGGRMSNFNGHEVLFSYSGDAVYLYSTRDSPEDPSTTPSTSNPPSPKRRKVSRSGSSTNSRQGDNFDSLEAILPELYDAQGAEDDDEEGEDEETEEDEDSEEEEDADERPEDEHWPGVPTVMPRQRFAGACNVRTVKDVNFVGPEDEFVASGSDDGNFFLWKKEDGALHFIGEGDGTVVNVIEPHPELPLLAISGIDTTIKLFAPTKRGVESKFSRMAQAESIIQNNSRPTPMVGLNRASLMALLAQSGSEEEGRELIDCRNQ